MAVWPQLQGHYLIQAAAKTPAGSWEPPIDISPPGEQSLDPQVAMNAVGGVVAVWVHRGSQVTIKAASRTPQGNWGAVESLSVPGEDSGYVDVAIGPAGDAVAIWTKLQDFPSDYIIEAATRSPGGQWGPPVALSEAGRNAWGPKLAVDPSGHVIAVWSRYNDSGNAIIQAAEKDPGEPWSEPEDVSIGGADAFFPDVEISAESAVVVWERDRVVEGATREAGGAWQAPVEISGPGSGEPGVGMDSSGNALAVWSSESEDGLLVKAATLPIGDAWTEPIAVSEPQLVEAAQPQVAVDPAGRAIAIWTGWDGTARVVEAASGAVGGDWESPVTVSPPDSWSHRPQVAMDGAGNAVAAWRAAEPLTMQAALFDVAGSGPSSVSEPSPVSEPSLEKVDVVANAVGSTRGKAAHPWRFYRTRGMRTIELSVGWTACDRDLIPTFRRVVTERSGRATITVFEDMPKTLAGAGCLKLRGIHRLRVRLGMRVEKLKVFDGSSSPPVLRFRGRQSNLGLHRHDD